MNKNLKQIIKADCENNHFTKHSREKQYIYLLRKAEYYQRKKIKIGFYILKIRLVLFSNKYLTYIPLFSCQYGLSIAHLGSIYVNGNVRIGKNVRISQCVTIGSTNGKSEAPKIGNNVFIGPNVTIIGDITIADDVAIGAGAVVVKSILEKGTTWGGVPAKKISDNDSHSNLPFFNNK